MDEDLAQKIIEDLLQRGARHVQVRMGRHVTESMVIEKGNKQPFRLSNKEGIGIRVLMNEGWGFAASLDFEKKHVEEAIKLAYKTSRASNSLKRDESVDYTNLENHVANYRLPVKIRTIDVDHQEKQEYLSLLDEKIRTYDDSIVYSRVSLQSRWNEVWFFNSEGARIVQHLGHTGMSILAVARSQDEIQHRLLQNHESVGWNEFIKRNDPEMMAETAAHDAVTLVQNARKCPNGDFPLILEPFQLGLTIHESCAHPSELDRVLGYEADFAGTSFLTTEKLGTFKYGNEMVTIVNDPTMPDVLAHYHYDDEGTKAKSYPIIDKGIFVNYETDVEFSSLTGFSQSNGNSKAETVHHIPIIRIANLYMEPPRDGYQKVEEIIADTKEGILAEHWKSHSIDDVRLNFQFNTQIGYYIKNGEIQYPLKNVTYQGYTPKFWNSVDAATRTMRIYGLPYCGKGNPMQVGFVSHGGPWVRFNKVRVGIID